MLTIAMTMLTSVAAIAQPAENAKPASGAQAAASALDKIIDPGVKPQRLAEETEFRFLEGPVWVSKGRDHAGYLLFSDIPADAIYKWIPNESGGSIETLVKPSRHSNGLMLDAQGRLLVCEHERRVVRFDTIAADAKPTVLAEAFEGKRLNSPNDLDIKSDGAIYFTDPPYGLNPGLGKAGEKELDYHGVFRIGADGQVSLLSKELKMPNGIAFGPDEKLLYIADMGKSEIRVFDVKADGSVENNRLFAEVKTEAGKGAGGDGVRVDVEGNVYVAGRSGIFVFDSKGAKLGVIAVPQGPANLCFGGDDYKTMYITAQKGLYRVAVKIAGKP